MNCIISNDEIYLLRDFLLTHVKNETLKSWRKRGIIQFIIVNGKHYYPLFSIPDPSRCKLPSEQKLRDMLKVQQHDSQQAYWENVINKAFYEKFTNELNPVRNHLAKSGLNLPADRIEEAAKKIAVFKEVLKVTAHGEARFIQGAIEKHYPNIKTVSNYAEAKNRAAKDIMSYAIKGCWFNKSEKKFDKQVYHWITKLACDGAKYNRVTIHKKVKAMCEKHGLKAPSPNTVKEFVTELLRTNIKVYEKRYGETDTTRTESHVKRIAALNAGTMWEVDGWTIPLYNRAKKKLVVFVVKDVHSRKIVGYSFSSSENTQMILEGLHTAVKNTKYVPSEIVSDNHVFNQTDEASHFKEALKAFNTTWTVTSNPQRKAHIERGFRYFEEPLKDVPGYMGQGVKTREKDGRPSQEYKDLHLKADYLRTDDEIKVIMLKLIEDFNSTPLKPLNGKTPNEVHQQSEKKHACPIDLYQRVALFTKQSEHKVSKGAIIIQRSGNKYEFRLNDIHAAKLNQLTVQVHYEDLREEIYIYSNNEFMCTAKPVQEVHQAKADQTPKDAEILFQAKGRVKGRRTKAQKELDELAENENAHPDLYHDINQKTTTKAVVAQLRERNEQALHELIDVDKLEHTPIPTNNQPENTNKNKKLFSPTDFIIDQNNMYCTD